MAFDKERLASMRRAVRMHRKARDGNTYITAYDKPQINAVLQALGARLTGARSILNADIEGAAPGVFSTPDKILLVAEAMQEFVLVELGRSR